MFKQYLSRAQTRAWSFELPIGDPTGGAAYGEKNDPVTAGIASVGGSIVSGLFGSNAASNAADASSAASAASIAEQRRQFDINQANQAPYLAAGTGAVNRLGAGVAAGGEFGAATPFNFQYDQNADPGTAFRMSEGLKALDRSAAARGGLLSGAALKGIEQYGQGLASQEYQNAFNRYTTGFNANTGERNQLYNRIAGVAGTGQTAVNQVGAQGANMAGNIGNTLMSNAANTGNAALASAGMRNSAFSGAGNALGRLYGNYGQSQNAVGQQLSNQYGYGNVYGAGGGGQTPTATNWDV
jgi:hypothetical protein